MPDHNYFANLIWQIADLLRGPYRPPQYERVMLPMTVLRRFDCVLASSKAKVLAEDAKRKGGKVKGEALDRRLNNAAGQRFHNHSPLDFEKLKGDPDNIDKHLVSYIKGFSGNVRDIFDFFEFENEIERMREANILYLVVSKFCDVDLHPSTVPNEQMDLIFENLIRRFNELANETAGDHFTPREVIRLMVSILFIQDDKLLATPGTVRKLLDPACGTGGMLAEAQNYLREHHGAAKLYVYGQDYNKRAFATAASDMLMKQVDHNGAGNNVRYGDSFTEDQFAGETFDYFLTNPPFGVDWKKQQKEIRQEHDKRGFDGPLRRRAATRERRLAALSAAHVSISSRTHAAGGTEARLAARHRLQRFASLYWRRGLGRKQHPQVDHRERLARGHHRLARADVLQHRYQHLRLDRHQPQGEGSARARSSSWTRATCGPRAAARTTSAASATSAGISPAARSPGSCSFTAGRSDGETSKIFDNADFGYTRVTVERPLRLHYQMTLEDKARFLDVCPHLLDDVQAIDKALGREPKRDWNAVWSHIEDVLHSRKSRWKSDRAEALPCSVFTQKDPGAELVTRGGSDDGYEPDADLRDFENVPLKDDIDAYFEREVRPHVPDAWMDRSKDKVGYDINLNRSLLQVHAAAPAGGDRCGTEARGGRDHALAAGDDGVMCNRGTRATRNLLEIRFRLSGRCP